MHSLFKFSLKIFNEMANFFMLYFILYFAYFYFLYFYLNNKGITMISFSEKK